ncbi:MAG: GNAT family N-acetyltransferase [Bacillota bacterium]|nr:GNAT family N-acetyltransferase [Bacillota bacterium]
MIIRKATESDIDNLIKLRLAYIKSDENTGLISKDKEEKIKDQLKEYFPKHLAMGDFIAFVAEEDKMIISSAYLVIVDKPANTSFINGKTGTLLNVFTYPEYRRQGIATKVIGALIDEAKKLNISQLNLLATDSGKKVYEKLGFTISSYSPMSLKL